ncbi:hypothetical protein ACWD4L_48570, partial [Streptomyces sp. NPDC002596]
MSNSDQQRPYGQEPGTGTGYGYGNGLEPQSYGQQVPYDPNQAIQDPGVAQTWEGQTWDTQYQPAVPPTQQPQQPEYGQPQQYAQPQYEQPYAQQYAQPQYEQPYVQQHEQPQYEQPQYEQPQYEQSHPAQAPQQPVAAAAGPAVDAGYPIPQGASGSYPLPPEVPAA